MSVYLRYGLSSVASVSGWLMTDVLIGLPDAVPKKRGPKTDVLEALLKRVDGLEKRLQDENHPISPASSSSPVKALEMASLSQVNFHPPPPPHQFPPPVVQHPPPPPTQNHLPESMLDTYFARLHGKPFFILDETATRQRYQRGQLPSFLSMAIYALTLRYTSPCGLFPCDGPADRCRYNGPSPQPQGLDYARQARRMVDIDRPSTEGLQTLLLLSQTFFAYGHGKRAYMTLSMHSG